MYGRQIADHISAAFFKGRIFPLLSRRARLMFLAAAVVAMAVVSVFPPATTAQSTNSPPRIYQPINGKTLTGANRYVWENTAIGTELGYPGPFGADDPDGDTLTWSIGGPDAASFRVDEGKMYTTAEIDFEEKGAHYVTVTVDDGNGGTYSVSTIVHVVDLDEPPPPAENITVTAVSGSILHVSWTAPEYTGRPALEGYDLRYRTAGFPYWKRIYPGYGTPVQGHYLETEYTIGYLSPSTSYEIQVRTDNGDAWGTWSDSVIASTHVNSPPVIAGPETVAFTWPENNSNVFHEFAATDADGHEITWMLAGNYPSQLQMLWDSRVMKPKPWLDYEKGSSYSFTVIATDNYGEDMVTVHLTVTDMKDPPPEPDPPTVIGASSSSLNVSWTAPDTTTGPPITGYEVRYQEITPGVWPGIGIWTDHPHTGTGTSTTIGDLKASTSYNVKVRATNADGNSYWSAHTTGTTLSDTAGEPDEELADGVEPAIPAITEVNVSHPATATVGDTVVVTVSATGDVDTNGKPYRWDHHGGSEWRTANPGNTFQAGGWPTTPGTRTFEVFVTGTDGVEYSSGPFSITWENPQPAEGPAITNVSVSHPATATVGDTVVVTVSATGDVDTGGKPYRWDHHGGSEWRTANPNNTFVSGGWPTTPGTRTFEVFVTGTDGVEYSSGPFSITWED